MKQILAALAIVVLAPAASGKTYDVIVYNACPSVVSLTLWLNGTAKQYDLKTGKYLKLRNAHNSRTLEFKARASGFGRWKNSRENYSVAFQTSTWVGKQVKRIDNGRFAYTDTWADVDFDLCDSPNSFPWFISIDDGGDTVYPAECSPTSAASVRVLNFQDIETYTWCPIGDDLYVGTPRTK